MELASYLLTAFLGASIGVVVIAVPFRNRIHELLEDRTVLRRRIHELEELLEIEDVKIVGETPAVPAEFWRDLGIGGAK